MYTNEFRYPFWRKSVRSFNGTDCVEVAQLGTEVVGLRDSKLRTNRECPVLRTGPSDWEGLTSQIKSGAFHA